MMTAEEFYQWEKNSRDTIDVKRCYIDIAGDLVSGLLLSQIIYWFIPGEKGSKLRVMKEDRLWLAKGRMAWWDECRISPKQFDRAIKILRDKKLVEIKRFRFDGSPSIHIWLNIETLLEGVNSSLPKGKVTDVPKGKVVIDQSVNLEVPEKDKTLTETTSETTTKTTPRDKLEGEPSPSSNNGREIGIIFESMRAFYGYPDKTSIDPIPHRAKEGKAIKRLLARGFTIEEILKCWMDKCQKAGCFKSMVFVNEDISVGKGVKAVDKDKYTRGRYGHLVRQ